MCPPADFNRRLDKRACDQQSPGSRMVGNKGGNEFRNKKSSRLCYIIDGLLADRLNLHELPAEPPFDAKIAMRHAMVQRRGYANDLAFLLVYGEIAADAAIRADGVSLGLAPFVPSTGLAHVIFALKHQRSRWADANAVTTIDISRVRQGNVKFSGNAGGEAATRHGNREGILRVYATGFNAFIAKNALGVVADVKFVVNFYRLGDCGAGCTEALRMRAVPQEITMLCEMAQAMRDASICGLGQTAASALESARPSPQFHPRAYWRK
jgi:hypothetical protein